MTETPSIRRAVALVAFALPLVVYLAGMRYVGSGDTAPAELLPISLLTRGTLDFDAFTASGEELPYWFRRVGGHVVSAYPIAAGLVNVPIYAAAKIAGVDLYAERYRLSMITASLASALSVFFLFLAFRRMRLSDPQALGFALLYAFGTCVWSVASRGLWQHTPAVLFLTLAFWLLSSAKVFEIALGGLVLGLATASRPPLLVVALAGALFVMRNRPRAFLPFAGLAVLPALLAAWYSRAYLQNAFAFGQAYRPGGFGHPSVEALAGLLMSPSRGLFVFSPVLVAGVAGAVAASRSDAVRLARYLALGSVALLVLFASWGMWWGGASFGYRVILEVAPVLAFAIPFAWNRWIARRAPLRWLFAAALAVSVFVQALGAYLYPSGFDENLELETARLWNVRDSELTHLTAKLFGRETAASAALTVPTVWWTPGKNDDSIPGWLDNSPGGNVVRGALTLSGWAKSASGEVDVRVAVDDGRILEPERFPRPDVGRVVPEIGETSRAGFRLTLSPPAPGRQNHALAVELRSPTGKVRRFGPIRFRWLP